MFKKACSFAPSVGDGSSSERKFSILNSRSGFTLIELLVFAVIFSGIMIAFLSILVTIIGIQTRQSSVTEVTTQSNYLLQKIEYLVERASLIELPQDTPTTTLKLRMAASGEDPTLVTLSNGIVYLQQGAGQENPLTSNKVIVSALSFSKYSNPPGHDSVSVSFLVSYNSPNVKQQFSETLNTAVARVSAATFDANVIPSSTATFDLGVPSNLWRSVNNVLYFSGTNVGIGTTIPSSALDVAGEIKFGNTSSTCNAGREGQQRYNITLHQMEFCDGSAWGTYGAGGSSSQNMQIFTSSGTFTIPAGVTKVKVTVVGGGGGGGGWAGGGGGGGGTAIRSVSGLTPGANIAVTVGAGTVTTPWNAAVGASGGSSSFGAFASATGGAGGSNPSQSGTPTGQGGAGGIGASGNLNIQGQAGGRGILPLTLGQTAYGGYGGSSSMGGGGAGGFSIYSDPVGCRSQGAGITGGAYGGGGGGAATETCDGGAGAAGVVIVEY